MATDPQAPDSEETLQPTEDTTTQEETDGTTEDPTMDGESTDDGGTWTPPPDNDPPDG